MSLIRTIQDKMGLKSGGPKVTEDQVKAALSNVIDPDLHKDIVSLGFVTKVEIRGSEVAATINLTTPACPVKDQLKQQAVDQISAIPGVTKVDVEMTAETRGRQASPSGVATGAIPALAGVRNLVAVASGKGGVGKSTTTVNLAYALAKTGAKVGVLDCDVYGPSIPLMMNVNGGAAAKNDMLEPPLADGIKVISIGMFSSGGPNKAAIMRGPMAGNLIKQFLSQVNWGELDYLLMDYPPGTGDIQLTISQTAPLTGAVIVTTPQEVSLIDVRKAISMFETLKVPVVGVVETMSYYFCKGEGEKHFIFGQGGGEKLCAEYGLPFLGGIPIEPAVVQGGDKGQAIVKLDPENDAAKAYSQAAGQTAAQVSIINAKDGDALEQFSLVWKKR